MLFDERLMEALHVVWRLARPSEAIANVLEAAGPLALERGRSPPRRAGFETSLLKSLLENFFFAQWKRIPRNSEPDGLITPASLPPEQSG